MKVNEMKTKTRREGEGKKSIWLVVVLGFSVRSTIKIAARPNCIVVDKSGDTLFILSDHSSQILSWFFLHLFSLSLFLSSSLFYTRSLSLAISLSFSPYVSPMVLISVFWCCVHSCLFPYLSAMYWEPFASHLFQCTKCSPMKFWMIKRERKWFFMNLQHYCLAIVCQLTFRWLDSFVDHHCMDIGQAPAHIRTHIYDINGKYWNAMQCIVCVSASALENSVARKV